MPPLKQEYIELLRRNIEEYRNIDFIDNRRDVAIKEVQELPRKKISHRRVEGKKERKKQSFHKMRKFTPEEDKVIMKIQKLDKKTVKDLCEKFKRDRKSIKTRYRKLRITGSSTKSWKRFSLDEDFLIIDEVLKIPPESGKLRDFKIKNKEELSISFGRSIVSVEMRWISALQVWLLGYYTKTLNLDIRTMLSKYLAENYQKVDSINWESICSQKEFSGHTQTSLRAIFHSYLQRYTEKYLNLPRSQITLEQIADCSGLIFKNAREVSEAVKTRQMEVIDYFEKSVKKLKIKDFL